MVNTPKKNQLPLPAGKYRKSMNHCRRHRHHLNEGKSCLEPEKVRSLEALRSLRSKKKLSVQKRLDTYFLRNEEKKK